MCSVSLVPYAAKAIIEHGYAVGTLTVNLTFRFSMDVTVFPAAGKWSVLVDGVPKAVGFAFWNDAYTLSLFFFGIAVVPTSVFVSYLGPDINLKTTWEKQWEPWAFIESVYILATRGQTSLGGHATRLTNKTGAATIAGEVVCSDPANVDSVILCPANDLNAIGVFLDAGISDGSLAFVVRSGRALVRMDAGGCAIGDRIITSGTPGRGLVNNTPSVAAHFQEIGHAVQSAVANATARCMIHFL